MIKPKNIICFDKWVELKENVKSFTSFSKLYLLLQSLTLFFFMSMWVLLCACTWVCGCLPSSAVGVGDSSHAGRDPNSNLTQSKKKKVKDFN